MNLLGGARVGLLEARLSSELAELVRREGGVPVCAPAVREASVDVAPLLPALVADLHSGRLKIVVFLTGAGATSLLDQARDAGAYELLVDALHGVTIVCRGPKPAGVLRKHGIAIDVNARSPYTTSELLEELPETLVGSQGVALVHDGGGNPVLVGELQARGARVQELRSYEWRLPADIEPIERLISELVAGRLAAVAFTNQVQARHLFAVASRTGLTGALRDALAHRTIVASIGPTCSHALESEGVPPHVVASPPKMRPLVAAIGAHLAARRDHFTADSTS